MLPHPELDFRRTPVTLLVAAVAVAIELVCSFDPARREVYAEGWKLGMLSPVWSGQLWRPFTATLLHVNFIHVFFNVYCLLVFGRVLEPFFGSLRYFLVLALLAGTSSMASFLTKNWATPLDGQLAGVGLSGVIYGLFGILWVGQRYRAAFREVCSAEVIQMLIAWFFFCIVLTYLQILRIDNVAHGVGCAVGVLYGQALFQTKHQLLWRGASVLVTSLAIGTMIAVPGHPLYEKHVRNEAIRARIKQLEEAARPPAEHAPQTPTEQESPPTWNEQPGPPDRPSVESRPENPPGASTDALLP